VAAYFFYGTLMDRDVLTAVIGRVPPAHRWRPARLAGYRRVYRARASYPVLVEAPGQAVDGILAGGLGRREAAKLDAFEGDDYRLIERTVTTDGGVPIVAHLFLPVAGVPATGVEWTLADWRRHHKREFLRRIQTSGKAYATPTRRFMTAASHS
jgi:gamma-glutamylcyclotransferase (GGCT)/AIG2-like uncharacterized protein YtfP